ncbi:MAG: (d)CMP kinase [Oscillospiraceae bacterium]|jgi:cytidylate kinase|nr:(d)CMP kinase [Oscillospiraceae bacterium]
MPGSHYSVAIDGPSGAGKSTLARRAAGELGFLYVDTGALYRALALQALQEGVPPGDEASVALLLETARVSLRHEGGTQLVFLSGLDVTLDIRAHEVSRAASDISALPAVRAFLLDRQRALARETDVIMDGRDIGTVVLPGADLKIFLTAAPEDRARRRHTELTARGAALTYDEVLRDLLIRDKNDAERPLAPLKPAPDAVLLDTTGNTFSQSLALILRLIRDACPERFQ